MSAQPRIVVCGLFLLAGLTPGAGPASEIDSFTMRFAGMRDATILLDEQTNRMLRAAVQTANDPSVTDFFNTESSPDCEEERLYQSVRAKLGRNIIGQLESYIDKNDRIDKAQFDKAQTIYRDFGVFETPTLGLWRSIGAVIRIGDHVVGSDKFGHFFAQGYSYFRRAYGRRGNVLNALRFGDFSERYLYGALTTGVYSYADLVANFQGMRFWNDLLRRRADVLDDDDAPGPYVACQNGRWVKIARFHWRDYIDAAWDEGINCSAFRNADLAARVVARWDELERDTGRRARCPIDTRSKPRLIVKYGPFAPHLLNIQTTYILP